MRIIRGDFYCAICGGPLSRPYWKPLSLEDNAAVIAHLEKTRAREEKSQGTKEFEDSEAKDNDNWDLDDNDGSPRGPPSQYDPRVLSWFRDDKLNWLDQFRVVSGVPEEYGKTVPEAWVSGPGRTPNRGTAAIAFPETEGPLAGTVKEMAMYNPGESEHALAVPFHDQCHDLLLKWVNERELDAEAFYETVYSLRAGFTRLEDVQYGEIEHDMRQRWSTTWGREWLVMSPFDIPDLQLYYNNLPKIGVETPAHHPHVKLQPAKNDPFSRFPPEILGYIMDELSLDSISEFRLASRAVWNLELSNHFWKTRVSYSMGFLFDMPASIRKSGDVDWCQVYKDTSAFINHKGDNMVRGLANRARIWNKTLPQIGELYLNKLAVKQLERSNELSIFKGAKSDGLARLVYPEPKGAKITDIELMSMPHLIHGAKLELVVSFNEYDEIANLGVVNHAETTLAEEAKTITGRCEKVPIPDNRWVVGFIITTSTREPVNADPSVRRQTKLRRAIGLEIILTSGDMIEVGRQRGDQKIIHVADDHFLVGLRVHQSIESSVLCGLGLFYHQSWRAGLAGSRHTNDGHADADWELRGLLWRRNLPPSCLTLGELHHGYWKHDIPVDIKPMESLVFDAGWHQHSRCTSISADVLFGGFRVTFANERDQTIGPNLHAMKTLTIDEAGGERIESVYYCNHHTPTSIRLVTNRKRQLVIGQPDDSEMRIPTAEGADGRAGWVRGLFAHWSEADAPRANLDVIGGFKHAYEPEETLHFPAASRQRGAPCWEPAEPAEGLTLSGPRLGAVKTAEQLGTYRVHNPDRWAVKTWLDCSRAVASVRTTLCHTRDPHALPLVGVTLTRADGSTASIGPDTFPTVLEECSCSSSDQSIKEEREARPHYIHDMWIISSQCLAKVRFWLWPLPAPDKGHTLAAMSWVATDGSESPIHGHYGRTEDVEEVHEIELGDGRAIGLAFDVGDSRRGDAESDYTMQAVQALVRSH